MIDWFMAIGLLTANMVLVTGLFILAKKRRWFGKEIVLRKELNRYPANHRALMLTSVRDTTLRIKFDDLEAHQDLIEN